MRMPPRRLRARGLVAVAFGVLLTAGAGVAPAMADDNLDGGGEVTISVTIPPLERCTAAASDCADAGYRPLAMTGAAVGVPLAAGLLLVALGAGAHVLAGRRRETRGATRSGP